MWLDPEVAKRKFDFEVESIRRQEAVLRALGCYVVRVNRPEVDAVFLPQKTLLAFGSIPLANVAARSFGVRIDLEGFDVQPPSVTFRNPTTWEHLPFFEIPSAFLRREGNPPQSVLISSHLFTHLPFLCIQGLREYHSHIEHTNHDWFTMRSAFGLLNVLMTIADLMCHMHPVLEINLQHQMKWGIVQMERT